MAINYTNHLIRIPFEKADFKYLESNTLCEVDKDTVTVYLDDEPFRYTFSRLWFNRWMINHNIKKITKDYVDELHQDMISLVVYAWIHECDPMYTYEVQKDIDAEVNSAKIQLARREVAIYKQSAELLNIQNTELHEVIVSCYEELQHLKCKNFDLMDHLNSIMIPNHNNLYITK